MLLQREANRFEDAIVVESKKNGRQGIVALPGVKDIMTSVSTSIGRRINGRISMILRSSGLTINCPSPNGQSAPLLPRTTRVQHSKLPGSLCPMYS